MQNILAVFGITPQTGPKYILFGIIFFVTLYLVFRRTTDKLDERITRVEDHLSKMSVALVSGGDVKSVGIFGSKSPLTLTPKGIRLMEQGKFILVFESNHDKFFGSIDSRHPKSKFDVEMAAQNAIIALLGEEWMLPVKIFLYDNPIIKLDDEDIQHRDFYKAAAIYVRDKYLEAHPALP